MKLGMNKKYNIAPHISWQLLMDKLYIIDERNQDMYILEDEISKRLWNGIWEKENLKKVIDDIAAWYQVEKNIVEKDSEEWLEEMVKIEVLREVKKDEDICYEGNVAGDCCRK